MPRRFSIFLTSPKDSLEPSRLSFSNFFHGIQNSIHFSFQHPVSEEISTPNSFLKFYKINCIAITGVLISMNNILYHFGKSEEEEVIVHYLNPNLNWKVLTVQNINSTGFIRTVLPYIQSYCPTMKNDDC